MQGEMKNIGSETGNGDMREYSELNYAALTGKLSGLMVLFPENESSELLHPGWRGPIPVSQKPLQKRSWNN